MTICNVPIQINGDVLIAYLCKYSSVEVVMPLKASDETAHGNYILTICLNWKGFQDIPHIICYEEQQMLVVVESKRLLCWACKQLGHIVRTCPQKIAAIKTTGTTTSTTTNTRTITSITSSAALEPEVSPVNQEKG